MVILEQACSTSGVPSVEDVMCVLQRYRKEKDVAFARCLHLQICSYGLDSHRAIGNYLVPMFLDCGSMPDGQQVFLKSVSPNEYSWTSLIHGSIELGQLQHALDLFEKMHEQCVHPSRYTLQALLKACGRLKCIDKGQDLHMEILKEGFETDCFVGNTLVDMYAKCGFLAEAQGVFDELPVRDVVSWTALIAGYAEHGLGEEAFNHLEKMQSEGVSPDTFSFVCILSACSSLGAIEMGCKVHAEIAVEGLEKYPFVGNTLVHMYAKCGQLAEAKEVVDELFVRDVVSWNALIAGYAEQGLVQEALNCLEEMQLEGVSPDLVTWNTLIAGYVEHGFGEEALSCMENMQSDGVSPDTVTYISSLNACASIGAVGRGQDIHLATAKEGIEDDSFVGNALVDMYAKCGALVEAQEVFRKLPTRDVISWTALIAGYAEYGFGEDAINCLRQMQLEGVFPNAVTFVLTLKACSSIGAIGKGQEIHTDIVREGFERDPVVGSTLVDMYAKCGSLAEAQEVFRDLSVRNVLSWNALMTGYAEQGFGEGALNCLEQMQLEGVPLDAVSLVCSLKACGSIGAIGRGREIHAIAKEELKRDPSVGNTLVDMYAKCGSLAEAREVLDELQVRNVVSWNALITGYVEHHLHKEALACLEHMQLEGVSPDSVTFVCLLKSCGSIGAIARGRYLHAEITKEGFEKDLSIGNTLVDMYGNCSSLAEAQEMFDDLLVRSVVSWNVLITGYAEHGLFERVWNCLEQMQADGISPNTVSWNAMIAGYADHGHGEEALNCLENMQVQGLSPDAVTFVCSLKACGSIGAISSGRGIHADVAKKEFENDPVVGNTLVDMYAKCGSLAEATEVFETLPVQNVVSWNALIAGYACQGESELVFDLFRRMREGGVQPDGITFLSVLTVCSHVGLVDRGQKYFKASRKDYGVNLIIEHHNCMIDLLGRAGQLDEAAALLETSSLQPNLATWNIVMGACQKWGNAHLGRRAFECAVSLKGNQAAPFILMSNIYADAYMSQE